MLEEKNILQDLLEIEKMYSTADHIIKVTYPVVKDSKLLLRGLESVYKGIALNISTILKVEHIFKRIRLTEDKEKNLELFYYKCASSYGLEKGDLEIIKQLLFLGKKHKESGIEFSRRGKFIILDDDLKSYSLTFDLSKEFLLKAETLLENTSNRFKSLFRKV